MSRRIDAMNGPIAPVITVVVMAVLVLILMRVMTSNSPAPALLRIEPLAHQREDDACATFEASIVHESIGGNVAPTVVDEPPAGVVQRIDGWFNGRPLVRERTLRMRTTAYSPDERSCGDQADGITASGYSVWTNGMRLVAADTSVLPFGTLVSIPGYHDGVVVPVLDRGGLIRGRRLDVLYPTHARARQWGVQDLEVTIWRYADGRPADFRQQHHLRSALAVQ